MDAEDGGGTLNDPGGWQYLVFHHLPDGSTTATHAVPPELEQDVLIDIVFRHGAATAHVDGTRCRRDALYHLDLGGMIFNDEPTLDVPLAGGRTLRVFRHQGRAILGLMRSLSVQAERRVGASGVPWVKAHGFFHCCVLLIEDLPPIIETVSALGDLAEIEADHHACVGSVLDAANRRHPGGEA